MDKVFIIAEAGVNHNGSPNTAKKMVDVAVKAGCDAVKFQTFKAARLVRNNAFQAPYQSRNTKKIEPQLKMLEKLEMNENDFSSLFHYCRKRHIVFMSTPFCGESVDFLDRLGMSMFKISSGDITNKPLIQHIASKNKPIILSTGMSDLEEVAAAVEWIKRMWRKRNKTISDLTLLHCVSNYPARSEDINLMAMQTLRKKFGLPVGFSDHTIGTEVAIAAVALGAQVIEKHFTLDTDMAGPDHKVSLEPNDLICMVKALKNVERALGNGIKRPVPSELAMRKIGRRSIVALRDIRKGERFSPENLTVKRPDKGLSAVRWDKVVGKIARRRYKVDSFISAEEISEDHAL